MTKEFSLHFTCSSTKIGILSLPVSPEIIALVTEIPRGEERWFKNFRFDMEPCKFFLKPQFANTNLTKAVLRSYIKDIYASLLFNIQRYFTCEGRYHKVYSYHFKLLLHFSGIISLDFPFFLFRSLAKMADKVQMKSQGCETSLFHHGLVKLIVSHELRKINREWSSFLFICGFGVETQETGTSPKAKETSTIEANSPAVTRSKRFVKLKPRKQVKDSMSKTSAIIREAPQPAQKKTTEVREITQEQSTSKSIQRRLTKSQMVREKGKVVVSGEIPGLKGNLNDILHAIDIEESPLVQVDFIKLDEGKPKKLKSSKKLDFDDEISKYVFKPRKPLTRKSKKMQETDMDLNKTGEFSNFYEEPIDLSSPMPESDKNRVFSTQIEKSSYEEIEEKLRLANFEISRLKRKARTRATEKTNFNRIKALWEIERVSKPKTISSEAQYFTWTVPAIKEAGFVRMINVKLRNTNRRLKR